MFWRADYTPGTLEDYKSRKKQDARKRNDTGKLQPDLNDPKLVAMRAKKERLKSERAGVALRRV